MLIWVSRIAFLALIWWLCSGIAEPFFAVMAFVSIAATLLIVQRMDFLRSENSLMPHILATTAYLPWLLKEIYAASLSVSRLIWQVTPTPKPVLRWIESSLKSPAALTAYGNSITLTPGTICADIVREKERSLVLVHALDASGIADLNQHRMEKRLRGLDAAKKRATAWW